MIPILYEKDGATKKITLNDSLEAYVKEERNGDFELELTYPVVGDAYKNLDKEKIIVCNANDYLKNQLFRIYNIRKSMKNRVKVYARHISFDLAHDWIDRISIENQSCEYAMNTIFRNSQFCQHYKGYSDIVNAQNFKVNKVTCLKAIAGTSGSIIDTYGTGAEILRDNTNLHVLNRRGHDNDVVIEYRKNLTGLEVEEDTTDLVTRIMPYAIYTDEDSQEVEVRGDFVDSPLINNYAHPYVKYIDYSDKFENDEVPTKMKLNNLAKKEYTINKVDIPKCNYKIEFIPLSKCAGYEGLEDRINLCDVVTVKDSRYNIDTQAKVIKVTYNVLRDRYESMELGEPKTTLGDVIGGTGNGPMQGPPGPPGPQGPAGADGSIGDFPESLPSVPQITAKVYGFANIEISWTFENKVYYSYELYASKTKGFVPNTFNLIFSGQASTYLYQAEPNETWYFRACALNTHGQRTEFSEEVEVSTVKISDLSNYVESAAIGDALIGELNLDRGWYGELRGNYIDAKQMSVTDGNGKRTLDIDSFGNVNLDVASLKIQSSSVATANELNNVEAVAKAMQDGKILHPDTTFKESYNGFSIYNNALNDSVTIERIPKPYDCPTTSTHCIKIKHTGQGGPGHGGFCQLIDSRPNAVFIQKIIAKLPPGRRLMLAHNPLGDGATDRWLTSSIGTGNWEEYIREIRCGSTGTFSTGGHIYVSDGTTPSHSNPLEWHVASCTVVDITDADDRVSNLTGRIKEAEQKITPEAITNTVKDHFYTKEETDSQITSQGYQTASEVQQTVDQLQIKFTQSGGYNFVRNGNAKNDQTYWATYYLPDAIWGIRNDSWTAYENAFEIYAANTTTSANAIYQIVDGLILGETYTVSALVAGHRGSNRIIIVNGEGTAEIGWSDEATDCYGGMHYDNWKRISGTFKATSDSCHLRLCHYNGWGNSYGWFKQIQINRGSIPLPYSPHPSEIYDGITTIDRDGIDVATSYGAHTQFHSGGMSSYNNSDQRTLGIENGGISFHAWNNNALAAYVTQSSLWGGSQSANGLAISTTANGTYVALGTSSLSDVNTTLNMDQALTISASDSFQPRGINLWKDVHAHGYGIRQLSHLKLAGSSPIQFDYLDHSPSTIYEAVDSGHSLYVMGGYQMHLGIMEGSGTPHGVIWMRSKTDTHSYTHWDFHNYTMYNMRTASTYANRDTRRISESYGVTSNVDGVRYLYKNVELVNGKAIRSIPLEYKGCEYDIVSIVCKGKGSAWVETEGENRFEIQGDCLSVNVEIIIYPADDVMMLSTVNAIEAPVLELPEVATPEIAPQLTNEGVSSCDFWNQYMYSKYLFNLKKVTQMSGL